MIESSGDLVKLLLSLDHGTLKAAALFDELISHGSLLIQSLLRACQGHAVFMLK